MNCDLVDAEFDRRLGATETEFSPGVRQHLAACARCRGLYEGLGAAPAPADIAPYVKSRITTALAPSVKPVKRIRSAGISTLQISILSGLFVAMMIGEMGTAGLKQMTATQLIAMTVLLAAGIGLLSLSLSVQMRPGNRLRVGSGAILGVFVAGLFTGIAMLFPWSALRADGLPCITAGLAMSIPGAFLLWLVIRRGAPLSLGKLGATLGAAAGLLGVTVLQFQCPHQQAAHLLVWHGGVLVGGTVAGLLAGRGLEWLGRRLRQPVH